MTNTKHCKQCETKMVRIVSGPKRNTPYTFARRKYCSKECQNIAQKTSFLADGNPNYRKRRKVCKACSKPFMGVSIYMDRVKHCRTCHDALIRKEKNPNWKGGITKLENAIRTSATYKKWKKHILERDKHCCTNCHAEQDLHVHHIKPFHKYPELIFSEKNGITLCETCHINTHKLIST